MSTPARHLRLYLDDAMRAGAASGHAAIILRIQEAFTSAGYTVHLCPDTEEMRARAAGTEGLHLFHMHPPEAPNTLTLRRAYLYPFWRIEATHERWNFEVASTPFDPSGIDPEQARAFLMRRRRKIAGARKARRKGFIFMPLQGRLTDQRSFQAASPLKMITATRKADPDRPILLRLHPGESYEAEERAALQNLIDTTPRLRLAARGAEALLADCAYVVTENSSLAFQGFFLEKPAVLFAKIDFHHIAGSVPRDGLPTAFARVKAPAPDYARYVWWFLRTQAIDATDPAAPRRILARTRALGWPV